jgi:transglutaminase-like putative cysteine protease
MKALKSYFPIIFFSIISFFSSKNNAQELPKMEWDKILSEDLKMKHWATDSTADAAILGDFGQIFMEEVSRNQLGFVLRRHQRIKIFNKSAFERANIRIVYRAKDEYEYVLKLKAQTILPNGKRIPMEPKSVFTEKLSEYLSVQKFTFLNVVEGAVLEFQYELASQNLGELRQWEFQHDIPIRHSFLNLNIESRFSYTYLFQGKDKIKSTEVLYDTQGGGIEGITSSRTRVSYYATDLPAMKKESFVSSVENYITQISFQLVEYISPTGAKQKVLPSWEKTVTKMMDDDDFGKMYLKKSKSEDVWEKVKSTISPTDSAMQKINTIYDWVNENIEWNGNLRYYPSKSPNEIYKIRKGNSADINILLIALLREAGIDANPVILSTRENGKPYKDYPFMRQYNHTIAHVDLNGKMLLLDCGNNNRPPGIIRTVALNDRGYLIRKKDSKWIDIVPSNSSQVSIANVELTEDGKLKGNISTQFKGILAAEKRYETERDETAEVLKKVIAKRSPDWNIDSVVFKNLKDSREPLQENFYLTINNVGQINDDFIYMKPTLQSGWEKNPFKLPVRYYPVEFIYPSNEQYVLNMKIPKGYKVEEMPKPINLSLPPDDGRFQYLISEKDNIVSLVVKISLKRIFFDTDSYDFLKKFFDEVSSKLDEQIVLKKVGK